MNKIKKFGFLCLSSMCLLVSCNKTYDAKGVKDFISKNYFVEKAKTLSDITLSLDASGVSGNDKEKIEAAIILELSYFATYYGLKYEPRDKDGKLISKVKSSNDNPVSKNSIGFKNDSNKTTKTITPEKIDTDYESKKGENDKINYVTCNNELSISGSIVESEISGGESKSKFTNIYNNVGQLRYVYNIFEAKSDDVTIKIVSIFNYSFEG